VKDWAEEVDAVLGEASGDLALAVGLLALRKTENGVIGDDFTPSRAYGVLSVNAPTYAAQLHVAANSFRHRELEYRLGGGMSRYAGSGFYTTDFLRFFSSKYAPIGAKNDPHGQNTNHAVNLCQLAYGFGLHALAALRRAWGDAGTSPGTPVPSGA